LRSSSWRAQGVVLLNKALALSLLVALAPVLLVIAFIIWRTDGAPIFFGHYRVGRNGKLFRCLKFRTMARNSKELLEELLENDPVARMEWERDYKLTSDPRITTIGAFLRRTSLDELPQLINVLRGEMVFVGPRPITYKELQRYGAVRWHYLSVPPGITGLWQVSGRNNLTYPERIEFDRQYVERRSLWLDVKILLRTVKVVFARDGAY